MKRKMMTMLGVGLALSVGALLVAPRVEARNVTTKRPAHVAVSTTANYTFIIGLDGTLWYTVSSAAGQLGAGWKVTGNANNPFDVAYAGGTNFTTGGFMPTTTAFCQSDGTVLGSNATVGTCVGQWVKAPGAASFTDGPTASLFGPIAATVNTFTGSAGGFPFLPSSSAMLINIMMTGQDGNIWYTLFDGSGNSGSATAMTGSSFGLASTPAGDPFRISGEATDTGWVSTTGLTTGCGAASTVPTRTCLGIWVPMP